MRSSFLLLALVAGASLARPVLSQEAGASRLVERGRVRASWPTGLASGFYAAAQPVVADFAGDGHLSVVLPGMAPGGKAVVAAWNSSGQVRRGFPMTINWKGADDVVRLGLPTVADLEGNGLDQVLVSGVQDIRGGPYKNGNRFVFICDGDGEEWPIQLDAQIDPSTGVTPLADVDGSGVLSIVAGQTLTTVMGKSPDNWPGTRPLHGYSPAIGDANIDGRPEIYQPEFERFWHIQPDPPEAHVLVGVDNTGTPLPGWPQKISDIVFNPVIGDVTGDDKSEVCVANGSRIHLWTWDGKPLPSTHPEGEFSSVFQHALPAPGEKPRFYTCVSLADLDGDDKAEILAMSSEGSLYAWHGDGRGVRAPDGFFASVQGSTKHNQRFVGVVASPGEPAVADLGDDGQSDIFVGNWWFTLHKDGTLDQTRMSDGDGYAPSIVNLDGDGKAQILFQKGSDLVVYDTGLSFPKRGAQWPTARGNLHRTGLWIAPSKRPQKP